MRGMFRAALDRHGRAVTSVPAPSPTTGHTARVPTTPATRGSWTAPALLAGVVGLMLLATPPMASFSLGFGEPLWPWSAVHGPWFDGQSFAPALVTIGSLVATAAVLLSRHNPRLATVLLVVPYLLWPLTATIAWGW